MANPLNAYVNVLKTVDRQEHFDADGGGSITRVIYCEPYTAHKRVLQALKGTVYSSNGNNPNDPNAVWSRAKPHSDPLFPWFYCNDVTVVPFNKKAATGQFPLNFDATPNPNDAVSPQFGNIRTALDSVDDFDGAQFIDNLLPAQIAKGGVLALAQDNTQTINTKEVIPINTFSSAGYCGCFIVATYNPLIFVPGIIESTGTAGGQDKFDYVDPQWEPVTLKTQLGRYLYFYSPTTGVNAGSSNHSGLTDTYEVPEVLWRFSVKRLMVPFNPEMTIGLFTNKINSAQLSIGDYTLQPGCWRMETPEITTRRLPDGNIVYDILLKFLVRKLWDEYWDPNAGPPLGPFGHNTGAIVKGWVGWNWQYGIPNSNFLELGFAGGHSASYYPVVWNGGAFQTFGVNHPLYLADTDVNLATVPAPFNVGTLTNALNVAPFTSGFIRNQ